MTSTMLTPRHPGPFQSHQRISYYFSKRGRSLLQVPTPNKFLLIAWKLIFREGVVLRLSTPNIVSTNLVVFLSSLILSDQPMTATLSLCFPFLFTLCRMHSSPHSSPCSAWLCPTSFLPFCHRRADASCCTSFPFHGRA